MNNTESRQLQHQPCYDYNKEILMKRLADASQYKIYPAVIPRNELPLRKILLTTRLWNHVRRQQALFQSEAADWLFDQTTTNNNIPNNNTTSTEKRSRMEEQHQQESTCKKSKPSSSPSFTTTIDYPDSLAGSVNNNNKTTTNNPAVLLSA